MQRRLLIIGIIILASSFFGLTKLENVQAACTYPAYCDPSGTTCNGGRPCYIGNSVCTGTIISEYSNYNCSGLPQGYSGAYGCDTPGELGLPCPGDSAGFCTATITNTSGCVTTCTDTHWPTCGGGGSCGWGAYGACSAPCGGGTQVRVNSCNGATQTQACNTQACPVPTPTPGATPPPCTWSGWSNCSASCGGGTRTRTDNCGNSQTESCNTQECPCTVGAWSACSATCGVGIQTRANNCEPGGVETRTCDTCFTGCACTVACGQASNCGTCSATDFGAPGALTLNPASGNYTLPANRSVTVSWSAAARAENYDVQIYPTGTAVGQECTAANTFCATATTSTSYTFTAPQGIPNFSWRVRPNNTTCNAVTYLTATASDEYLTTEGAAYDMVAANAVNGSDATGWNAGGTAPQWIELDLKSARTVTGIRIATMHTPAGSATYQIYAGPTANPSTLVTTVSQMINPGDVLTVTFASPVANTRYLRIVATSSVSWIGFNELTPYYSDGVGNWTNGTFTLVGPVAGDIYLDQNFQASLNLATGLCETGVSLPGQDPGVGASAQATWQGGGSATGGVTGTSYTVNNVLNYNNIGVQLTPNAAWRCTCPAGCTYSGQNIPKSGVNFFLANVAQPWWQTQNGLVYAGNTSGNALVSLIPPSCTSGCIGRFSYRNSLNASDSSGVAITGGGDIDVDTDPLLRYSKLRQDTTQGRVIGSTYKGPRENYQYFYNLYSMGSAPSVDFNGSQPTAVPVNGRAYYGSGNISINSPWTVGDTQSMVIFINGNLTINSPITVAEGGFLAFIVNGSITVSNTVGNATPGDLAPSAEGVYIADQIIIQGGRAGGDLKFVGRGTFVGWSSVTLGRTYNDPFTNDNYPTELFIFRPDFVKNVPERMTRPLYSWQETN